MSIKKMILHSGLLILATACVGHAGAAGEGKLPDDSKVHFPIDHVAWILDQETLDAIAGAHFLSAEFANSGGRKQNDRWTGFYLYGLHTQYLEFVSKARSADLEVAPGDGMVAFNAEKEGSVDWIVSRMSERHPESHPAKSLKTASRGKETIPHSHVATFDYETGSEGFGAWVLELHREFKNQMSGGRAKVGDINRTRLGAPVRHHPDKYFKDVVSLTAAVSDARRQQIVDLLTELGYVITQVDSMTVCSGEENVIELIPRTGQRWVITRLVVSLMRPKEGKTEYHFGADIVLKFGDGAEAVWEFGGTR